MRFQYAEQEDKAYDSENDLIVCATDSLLQVLLELWEPWS